VKAYVYSAVEAGLTAWPSGELRLEGFETTTNPDDADVFVCPGSLSLFQNQGVIQTEQLYRLPYLRGKESRNVFFDVSDNFTKPINLPIQFIRCDVRTWMLPTDPNTISVAWPVENYAECVELPEAGFTFDVSFQGWLSTDTRIGSSRSCREHPSLHCDIAEYTDFTGYIYYEPEGIRRRAEFRRSMRESRVCLCPESIPGVLPYRFFEAMSAGRVPVLVSSDYVLPFADKIPYDNFIIRVERNEAATTGSVVASFLERTNDEELVRMGQLARHSFLEWLNRDDWPRTMAFAVTEKLRTLGLCG
jgi:hypothetical protein